MVATIGSQIGQFIERKRAEEALMRSKDYLAEAQKLTHTGSWGCLCHPESLEARFHNLARRHQHQQAARGVGSFAIRG